MSHPLLKELIFKLFVLFLFSLISNQGQAQDWLNNIFSKEELRSEKSIYEIKERADEYFKYAKKEYYSRYFNLNDYPELQYHNIRDYIEYKRWEEYHENHCDHMGMPVSPMDEYREFIKFRRSGPKGTIAQWENINRTAAPGGYWGMGRIREIAFHPTNPDIFWLGADQGGIWKTSDNGKSYIPVGDNLPFLRVSSLCIDPSDPDIIYMAGGGIGTNYWQRAIGVYKSYDGGLNWQATGLSYQLEDNMYMRRLAINPVNPSVLIATTRNGTYRTTDGGDTWIKVDNGEAWDIMILPDGNTVFIGKGASILMSVNGGLSWEIAVNSVEQGTFKHFAFSPLNNNKLAAQLEGSGFTSVWVSSDRGDSWTKKSTINEDTGGTIGFSATNENTLYRGWMKIFRSDNLGESWEQITNWYASAGFAEVHADHFRIEKNPIRPSLLYFCNDGGLYIYDEEKDTWTERSEGLIISQYYSLSSSQSDPSVLLCGSQDNGGWYRDNLGQWFTTNGGDGMHTWQDPVNNYYGYSSYPGGKFYRTLNGWNSFKGLYNNFDNPPADGDWNSRFAIDPDNKSRIVTGCFKDIYESADMGDSWHKITTNLTGGYNLHTIVIPEANSDIIYTSSGARFYYSFDRGQTWGSTWMDPGNTIKDITVSDYDPMLLWLVTSGYDRGHKVYKSSNGGRSWENISGSLPNIPALSVIHQKGTTEGLYIGMTYGVYYRENGMSDWIYYGQGIPNTEVRDLDIQYQTGKIRCATYGRGLYETDLYTQEGQVPEARYSLSEYSYCKGEEIEFINQSTGATRYIWNFGDGQSSTLENPVHNYNTEGNYKVSLTALTDKFTSVYTDSRSVNIKPFIAPVRTGPENRYQGTGKYSEGLNGELLFNVLFPSRLLSFKVYSAVYGNKTFVIKDHNNNTINRFTSRIIPGENTVNIETEVPPGDNYTLGVTDPEGLFFNLEGANYPYGRDNLLSITGNTDYSAGRYYFFYDWKIQFLTCNQSSLPDVEEGANLPAERISVYPNPVRDNFTIIIRGFGDDENLTCRFITSGGKEVYRSETGTAREISINASLLPANTSVYILEVSGRNDSAVKQIIRFSDF